LAVISVTIMLGKLAKHNKPAQVAEWIWLRRAALTKAFNFKRTTVPSLNTIRRALADVIEIEELERLWGRFLYEKYGGRQTVLIVLDGKTLRETNPAGQPQPPVRSPPAARPRPSRPIFVDIASNISFLAAKS
jgi:hypothetical protein